MRAFFAPIPQAEQSPLEGFNDKWVRIIGYPLIILGMAWLFCWNLWDKGMVYIGIALVISAMYTVLIWESCRWIIPRIRRFYPSFHMTTQRIIVQSLSLLLLTYGVFFVMNWATSSLFPGNLHQSNMPATAAFATLLIPTVIMMLLYESRYFLSQWKKDIKKTEALANAHLQSQFEALKKQLDPHFLFNSLNTLASLIEPSNEPAQAYLDRLSDVYRYILETREKATVTLAEELHFLEAYLYLNKVRFRDNLQVQQEIPAAVHQKHLPSLSLQLLVENALKHNVVSREHPLTIRIFTEANALVVENNKQPKASLGPSTAVGLKNIKSRYELLQAPPISVLNHTDRFRVSLPLISL